MMTPHQKRIAALQKHAGTLPRKFGSPEAGVAWLHKLFNLFMETPAFKDMRVFDAVESNQLKWLGGSAAVYDSQYASAGKTLRTMQDILETAYYDCFKHQLRTEDTRS